MSFSYSLVKIPYSHNYANDLSDEIHKNPNLKITAEITEVVLPILSLFKPLQGPLLGLSNVLRLFSGVADIGVIIYKGIEVGQNIFELCTPIIACVFKTVTAFWCSFSYFLDKSVFSPFFIISLITDIISAFLEIFRHIQEKEFTLALQGALSIVDNMIYFGTFFFTLNGWIIGSLVLHIILETYSLATQCRNILSKDSHGIFDRIQLFGTLGRLIGHISQLTIFSRRINHLTKYYGLYEDKIQKNLGEEYLVFDPKDPREKFLVLSASTDWNSALDPDWGQFYTLLKKLDQRFAIRFRTISKVSEIKKEIDAASALGPVTGLLLRAHSSPRAMYFGNLWERGTLNKHSLKQEMFEKLDPKCTIILQGCETAKKLGGIAHLIHNAAKRTVFASDIPPTVSDTVCINPLVWNFNTGHTIKISFHENSLKTEKIS